LRRNPRWRPRPSRYKGKGVKYAGERHPAQEGRENSLAREKTLFDRRKGRQRFRIVHAARTPAPVIVPFGAPYHML